MPTSNAKAQWEGGLKAGKGQFEAATGAFSAPYGFPSRFEGTSGTTTPEELIAAAHAACFSMALAAGLERGGHVPQAIRTSAACTLEKVGEGWKITRMKLEVRGSVPGVDQAGFARAAEAAKNGCPVSGALKGNVEVTVDAKLE